MCRPQMADVECVQMIAVTHSLLIDINKIVGSEFVI